MKKITLTFFSLLLFGGTLFSQTNSTGQVFLSFTTGLEMGVQIDVTATEVTLYLGGPVDRWLGIGFGVNSMTSGGDVVVFDGTNLTDRTFGGIGVMPSLDSNQDWTVTLIDTTTEAGRVGVVATRALNTGEANDYVFNLTDTSINLVWARGASASFSLSNHGGSNRGITSAGFTLGVEDFDLSKFKISPNPVISEFNVELPNSIESANVEVYDVLGKMIYSSQVSNFNSSINSSSWNNGIYLVRVISGDVSQTKRIIKQ